MQHNTCITRSIISSVQCASPEELVNLPPPDDDTPSSIKITGKMTDEIFPALIRQLASIGNRGILGLRWELLESEVKRNLVSFHVGSSKHRITLVAHSTCLEIQVRPHRMNTDLHKLCSYTVSAVQFVMKGICKLTEPILAFDCPCDQHKGMSHNTGLCHLLGGDEDNVFFECCHGEVTLDKFQEIWFAKVGICMHVKVSIMLIYIEESVYLVPIIFCCHGNKGVIKQSPLHIPSSHLGSLQYN